MHLLRRSVLPLARSARPLVGPVLGWPAAAHHAACRNAMVALTECTRRRGEREDVARWFAERDGATREARLEAGHAAPHGAQAAAGAAVTTVSLHA